MIGLTLELFPCSGGLAEGLRRAGIVIDVAFDFDTDACDSYELNLGHRPVQMDVRDLLRMVRTGWSPGIIDLLVADPPCQPWSRAGKREGQADERDMLGVTAELIDLLRPRAWLIANVPGLNDSNNWETVVKVVIGGMASRCGYCTDYACLNAADFGVAQKRIRPFWFGHKIGTPCIKWPHPTHHIPPVLPGCGLKPWVTCREALAHLPIKEIGRPVRVKNNIKHPINASDAPANTITGSDGGGSKRALIIDRKPDPNRPPQPFDAPMRTITRQNEFQTALEWPWEEPATTIMSDERIAPPGHHRTSLMSHPHAVILSEKAAAILQGFPDNWQFCGKTKKARWSMLGQAMPPPLAEAVGRSITKWRSTIDGTIKKEATA